MSIKPKIVITVRSGYERHGWWHPLLGQWMCMLPYEQTYKIAIELVHGIDGLAASANVAAQMFLDDHHNAEWLCIVDNDTVPQTNILRMLDDLPDEVAIISPVCDMLRNTVQPQAGYYEYEGDKKLKFIPVTVGPARLEEVDRVGGGCWFIRRRVFDRMEKPYFKVDFDPETFQMLLTDDIYFQNRAQHLGHRLFVHTGYSASHFHTVDLSIFR